MKKQLFTYLLLLVSLLAVADTPEELFKKGNEAYANKEFAQAVEMYMQVIDQGYESFDLYYNLGNAYYKTNQVGPSILYYEKALKLDPSHPDAQFNLKLANLKVADKVQGLKEAFVFRVVNNWMASRSSDQWAKISMMLLWATLVFSVGFIFIDKIIIKRIAFIGAGLLMAGTLFFLIISARQLTYEREHVAGIIMVTNSYVKSTPDDTGVDLFILREGVKVKLLDTSGEWQKIELVDEQGDKLGWIPKQHVTPI